MKLMIKHFWTNLSFKSLTFSLILTKLIRSWYKRIYSKRFLLQARSHLKSTTEKFYINMQATVIEKIGGSISDGLHYVHLIVLGTVIFSIKKFTTQYPFRRVDNLRYVGNMYKAILINGWTMLVWQDTSPMPMFLSQMKLKMKLKMLPFYQHLPG